MKTLSGVIKVSFTYISSLLISLGNKIYVFLLCGWKKNVKDPRNVVSCNTKLFGKKSVHKIKKVKNEYLEMQTKIERRVFIIFASLLTEPRTTAVRRLDLLSARQRDRRRPGFSFTKLLQESSSRWGCYLKLDTFLEASSERNLAKIVLMETCSF